MVSNETCVKNYFEAVDREHYNKARGMYFTDNALFSYGEHFILAIKLNDGNYILNGDSYSITTSSHQSLTRRYAPDHTPIIPFSALRSMIEHRHRLSFDFEIELAKIEVIDVTDDLDTYEKRIDKNGNTYMASIHHLGASVIKYNDKYYLSSIDQSGKTWDSYFIVELPDIVNSVEEAYRVLAGNLTDEQYKQYQTGVIKRQGEYFFIPTELTTKQLKNMEAATPRPIIKNRDLSQGVGNPHIANETILTQTGTFVRNSIRHQEHKRISLKNVWHEVVINTAVNSWRATGNVD